jgi:hypothetical protein
LASGDGVDRQRILVSEFETKNIAGQKEAADLAPAVVQDLVGSHRALDHLVEIIGGHVLAEDLGAVRIRHSRAHERDLLGSESASAPLAMSRAGEVTLRAIRLLAGWLRAAICGNMARYLRELRKVSVILAV